MRKKLIALACVLCFSFALTACGNSENKENAQGAGTPSATVTEQPNNTPTETPTPTPHEHSYTSAVTKEATCSEVGETTYTCSCGDTYKEDIAKVNHIESEWIVVKEVEGTENGLQHKVCTVCDVELATEEIYPEVVASGKLSDANVEWKIIGTTLYVSGTGAIPNFLNIPTSGNETRDWQSYYLIVEKIVIEDGITKIGDFNFAVFEKTREVVFADTVEEIGVQSFYYNKALESLDLNQITKLGRNAFVMCSSLTKVVIPGSIKNIPNKCFSSCYNLSQIVIEEGVTEIGEGAFAMIPSFKDGVMINACTGYEIYVPESVSKIGDFAFATGASKGPITVYGKAGSYIEKWVKEVNGQPEVSFVAE